MVGPCPQCGSQNTHDCAYDEEESHSEFECPLIKALDDPLIGHCEECDSVFCTECGRTIDKGSDDPILSAPRLADHHKSCPEQKPERWAQKYGTTHQVVSVQGDTVTITQRPEELMSDSAEEETKENTVTLHLSKAAGMTPDEMKKRVGYYMKFSYDLEEIYAVAELESTEGDEDPL